MQAPYGQCSSALRTTRMGNAHQRSGRRAWAMLLGAQDDARGPCSSALRTTRVGNALRGRAFSFVAHPTPCVLRRDGLLPRVLPAQQRGDRAALRGASRAARCLGLSSFMSYLKYRRLRPHDVSVRRRYSTNKHKKRGYEPIGTIYEPPVRYQPRAPQTLRYPTMVLRSAFIRPSSHYRLT